MQKLLATFSCLREVYVSKHDTFEPSPDATVRTFADIGTVLEEDFGHLKKAPRASFVKRSVTGVVLWVRKALHLFEATDDRSLDKAQIENFSTKLHLILRRCWTHHVTQFCSSVEYRLAQALLYHPSPHLRLDLSVVYFRILKEFSTS